MQLRSLSSPNEIAHNDDVLRIFLMACDVKSTRLSVISLSCLQKLISHDAIAQSALKEILSTLKDVSLLSLFIVYFFHSQVYNYSPTLSYKYTPLLKHTSMFHCNLLKTYCTGAATYLAI